jgi:hypothetical protein
MSIFKTHPTHLRNTVAGIMASWAVGLAGGLLAWRTQDLPGAEMWSNIGTVAAFAGLATFFLWTAYSTFCLRCTDCGRTLFKWGESAPKTKTFHCKSCEIIWDSKLRIGD